MSMNNLIEELKRIDLMEREADDCGQGLDSLLQEFVYDADLPDEDKIWRTRVISDYYKVVYDRSHGDVPTAYTATRRKAMKLGEALNEPDEDVLREEDIDIGRGEPMPKEDSSTGYTEEMIKFYEDRTLKHISRVQRAARKLSREGLISPIETRVLLSNIIKHDQSKFEEPEYTPYVSLTWRHKIENEGGNFDPMTDKGYQTPGLLDKRDENEATLHHVRNNSHHPEYWLDNPADANIDPNNRNKSMKMVDATLMPDLYIVEMVADWQAMSEELGTNTARQWFNKCQDTRWHFSDHQVEFIDKCLRALENEMQESLKESAIDFPTDDLPRAIWGKKDGTYYLKNNIKDKVIKYIKSYPSRNLIDLSTETHICGSLATNLYNDFSDFDVHMVIDKDKVKGKEAQEKLTKEVLKWSDENPEDIEGYPCHIYMQDNENQEYVGDSLWDLNKEFWAKGPKISRKNFNPYSYYQDILGEVEKKAKEADIKIGELSRSVIDYASIKVAYKKIPKDAKASLRDLMKDKLHKIEDDIEALASYRKQWAEKRRNSSQPKSIEQAVTSKSMQKEWTDANAVFKFLQKYDYIETIKALEDILGEDAELSGDDVTKIVSILDIEKAKD